MAPFMGKVARGVCHNHDSNMALRYFVVLDDPDGEQDLDGNDLTGQ